MADISFKVDESRIRQLGSAALNQQMSGDEARAFLLLYAGRIEELLGETVKGFVARKLAKE